MSHRDIKAENVMREEGGRILLMDVGLSALEHQLLSASPWNSTESNLPYPLQWQNFQAGSYCVAIEPSTFHRLARTRKVTENSHA
jgi:serine/threonine protein kinase